MGFIDPCNCGTGGLQDLLTREVCFTGATSSGTVIDINSNGATWTSSGNTINLGATAPEFNSNLKLIIKRNDIRVQNGVNVIWDSSTSLHFTFDLALDEAVIIQQFT